MRADQDLPSSPRLGADIWDRIWSFRLEHRCGVLESLAGSLRKEEVACRMLATILSTKHEGTYV